ncbi:hypothetical protein ACFWIZ_33750, partial [Streptomyces sp. NPDC127044]
LLDTTRAAYLLVRNGIARTYPNIRFILSHTGGFVPYASHRMAVAIAGDTGVARDLLQAVNRGNAEVLFPRLAASPAPTPVRPIATRLRQAAQRAAARLVFKLVQPGRLSKVPKPPHPESEEDEEDVAIGGASMARLTNSSWEQARLSTTSTAASAPTRTDGPPTRAGRCLPPYGRDLQARTSTPSHTPPTA